MYSFAYIDCGKEILTWHIGLQMLKASYVIRYFKNRNAVYS